MVTDLSDNRCQPSGIIEQRGSWESYGKESSCDVRYYHFPSTTFRIWVHLWRNSPGIGAHLAHFSASTGIHALFISTSRSIYYPFSFSLAVSFFLLFFIFFFSLGGVQKLIWFVSVISLLSAYYSCIFLLLGKGKEFCEFVCMFTCTFILRVHTVFSV